MSGAPRLAQVLAGAPRGGAENFFTRLVTGLHEEGGLDQHAFIRPHPDRVARLRRAGVPVSGFRFPGPLRPLARYRYRRALAGFRPDRVLTWMNRASAATPPGPYTLISRLGHYYDLKHYRHADYWIGITRGICDHLVRGGMPATRRRTSTGLRMRMWRRRTRRWSRSTSPSRRSSGRRRNSAASK